MTRFKEWAKLKTKLFKIPNYSECMQVKTELEKIYIT